MRQGRFSLSRLAGIFLTPLAFTACFFVMCLFSTKVSAEPGRIAPVREYTFSENVNYHIVRELSALRGYYSDVPFEEDESLAKSAFYESVYVTQFCDRENVFPEHPDLMELKDSMYPDAEKRIMLFFSGNVCDRDDFYKTCVRALSKSPEGEELLMGDDFKIGVSFVSVSDYSILVIHASKAEEVRDSLPEDPVLPYTGEYSYEMTEYYAENGPTRSAGSDTRAPVIYSEEILLPSTGSEAFYDLSKYLTGYDDSGNISFHVSPAFTGPGYSGTAEVTCIDGSGNTSSAVLPVNYTNSSLSAAVSGNVFTCYTAIPENGTAPEETDLQRGTHLVFKLSDSFTAPSAGGFYIYSFKISGAVLFKVVTQSRRLLWNPPGAGVYTVTLEYVSGHDRTGTLLGTLNITVTEAEPTQFIAPEIYIRDGSSFKISDSGYGRICEAPAAFMQIGNHQHQ